MKYGEVNAEYLWNYCESASLSCYLTEFAPNHKNIILPSTLFLLLVTVLPSQLRTLLAIYRTIFFPCQSTCFDLFSCSNRHNDIMTFGQAKRKKIYNAKHENSFDLRFMRQFDKIFVANPNNWTWLTKARKVSCSDKDKNELARGERRNQRRKSEKNKHAMIIVGDNTCISSSSSRKNIANVAQAHTQ